MTNPQVKMITTEGEFTLELYPDKAPLTVKNFIQYVQDGHYNGTIFHRVMKTFMIQGGGYTEDLEQKPTREPIKNEASNGLSNNIGAIAMARTMIVDSATSQFFINVAENQPLDYKNDTPSGYGYCVFGKVIDGMETINRIRKVRVQPQGMHQHVPMEPIVIKEATVIA
jgi:peptidyl-prolyl cis-trans isomerase B (cyclophilin B)